MFFIYNKATEQSLTNSDPAFHHFLLFTSLSLIDVLLYCCLLICTINGVFTAALQVNSTSVTVLHWHCPLQNSLPTVYCLFVHKFDWSVFLHSKQTEEPRINL